MHQEETRPSGARFSFPAYGQSKNRQKPGEAIASMVTSRAVVRAHRQGAEPTPDDDPEQNTTAPRTVPFDEACMGPIVPVGHRALEAPFGQRPEVHARVMECARREVEGEMQKAQRR